MDKTRKHLYLTDEAWALLDRRATAMGLNISAYLEVLVRQESSPATSPQAAPSPKPASKALSIQERYALTQKRS